MNYVLRERKKWWALPVPHGEMPPVFGSRPIDIKPGTTVRFGTGFVQIFRLDKISLGVLAN
jgi:hypothetical protein